MLHKTRGKKKYKEKPLQKGGNKPNGKPDEVFANREFVFLLKHYLMHFLSCLFK